MQPVPGIPVAVPWALTPSIVDSAGASCPREQLLSPRSLPADQAIIEHVLAHRVMRTHFATRAPHITVTVAMMPTRLSGTSAAHKYDTHYPSHSQCRLLLRRYQDGFRSWEHDLRAAKYDTSIVINHLNRKVKKLKSKTVLQLIAHTQIRGCPPDVSKRDAMGM